MRVHARVVKEVEITDLQWLQIYVEGVQMPFAGDAYQGIVCLELI